MSLLYGEPLSKRLSFDGLYALARHRMQQDPLSGHLFAFINEKISYRLAQRPGSYVILKYVRPVIKRRDTQILSCPAAPVGVIDGSRADVSFIAGMMLDKFAFHLPLYRQHQRLVDAGINVSRAWLTQLMQASASLLEPIHAAADGLDSCFARQGHG